MGNAALLRGITLPTPPNRTYSGPEIPTAYDPNWQIYNNLSPAQIAWFQAQPEWQNFLSYVALNPVTATINANVSTVTINNALAAANIGLASKI